MVELIIEVPDELGERIKSFPSVNWMDVERKAIESKLSELELKKSADMRRILVEVISSKSDLSEDGADKFAVELGRKIKKGRHRQLKSMGVV